MTTTETKLPSGPDAQTGEATEGQPGQDADTQQEPIDGNGREAFAKLIEKARTPERQRMTPTDLDLAKRMALMYGKGPKNRDPYPEESEYYLHCIRKYNLDPMQRQICAVWRYDKAAQDEVMTVQTQIDGYRVIAARTGQYAGSDDPVFTLDDNGRIISCTQTVWRIVKNVRCPFTATAYWKEYKPAAGFMWDRMEHCMIAKCAEALALRKAFPADLGGLYIDAEMEQAQVVSPPVDAPLADKRAPTAPTRRERQNGNGNGEPTIRAAWSKWLGLATAARDKGDPSFADLDTFKAAWFKQFVASVLGHDVPDPNTLDASELGRVLADLNAKGDPRSTEERT